MKDQIYEQLKNDAKDQEVLTYEKLGEPYNLHMSDPEDRNELANILEEIAREEQCAGRPMLTSIVIAKIKEIPGQGFFKLAKEFGRYDGMDENGFWITARKETHLFWKSQNTN